MGGTSWDDDHYSSRSSLRAKTGAPVFAYSAAVSSGKVEAKAHDKLDPTKFKAGVRECRDNPTHPITTPIAIGLDVTGSMKTVPKMIQEKLPQLMGLLGRKGYVEGPTICMAAIGDAMYDRVPMQIGQFEGGIEIDDDISNLYLEGGGGGNSIESYELFIYFLARCVKADQFEKRNKKGYAFIICDEGLDKTIQASQVEQVFGQKLQADLDTAEVLQEALQNWNIFCIVPNMTSHYDSEPMKKFWREQLCQNVLMLDDPNGITEMIAGTIGVVEGSVDTDELVDDLTSSSTSKGTAESVSRALSTVAPGGAISKITDGGSTGLATLD